MDEDTKFRRALKSPWGMVSLCIVAGFAVYDNVIQSTMDSSLPDSEASITSPTKLAPTTSAPSLVGHDETATRWIDNPTRDPFAPVSVALAEPYDPSSVQTTWSSSPKQQPHTPPPTRLMLKAIAIEAEHRSAVINRQVVYEGEMIEGYQVVAIQLQGVWLKRHGKKALLTFATNTTSQSPI